MECVVLRFFRVQTKADSRRTHRAGSKRLLTLLRLEEQGKCPCFLVCVVDCASDEEVDVNGIASDACVYLWLCEKRRGGRTYAASWRKHVWEEGHHVGVRVVHSRLSAVSVGLGLRSVCPVKARLVEVRSETGEDLGHGSPSGSRSAGAGEGGRGRRRDRAGVDEWLGRVCARTVQELINDGCIHEILPSALSNVRKVEIVIFFGRRIVS